MLKQMTDIHIKVDPNAPEKEISTMWKKENVIAGLVNRYFCLPFILAYFYCLFYESKGQFLNENIFIGKQM